MYRLEEVQQALPVFESTSYSARLSNVSSATCLSFRFSSSSCFSFFACPLSIPTHFAFRGQARSTSPGFIPLLARSG